MPAPCKMTLSRVLVALAGVALASIGVVACAEDDVATNGAADDEVVAAHATSSGTFDGVAIRLEEGAARALLRIENNAGNVMAASSEVELSSGSNTCTAWKKNAQKIAVQFQNGEGDIEPNSVYEIRRSDDQVTSFSAQYSVSGDDCAFVGQKVSATGGRLKIVKATTQSIRGEYELEFGEHGTIKGTFAAPTCLKKRDGAPGAPRCED